eukprot:8971160-Pyramimonas_sp.AAC.1
MAAQLSEASAGISVLTKQLPLGTTVVLKPEERSSDCPVLKLIDISSRAAVAHVCSSFWCPNS